MLNELIAVVNSWIWGAILIYLLLGAGIWFTFRSRFVQIRHFTRAWRLVLAGRQARHKDGISSFQSLCTSLASHVGTGNIAGVAIALYLGGPGAVFWMWVVALLGMATSFIENTLAQCYKSRTPYGSFIGGPAYYIDKALKIRSAAVFISTMMVFTFGLAFNAVQSNSIALTVSATTPIPSWLSGVLLALLAGIIIFRGIHAISRVAERVVPFMALVYLTVALIVVVIQFDRLPEVLHLILANAFGLETAASGGAGFLMAQAINQGVCRGLFSNEAGMGSVPNAAATASPSPHHPATQGLISMVGVFADTIVICTATAAIILLSGQLEPQSGLTGTELTLAAIRTSVGSWGDLLIGASMLLFGFTSIIANYYYGESNLRFLHKSTRLLTVYRLAALVFVCWGAISQLEQVWTLADLSMGLMAMVNLIAIVLLGNLALALLRDFDNQLQSGQEPHFDRSLFPFLDQTIDPDIWIEKRTTDSTEVQSESESVSDSSLLSRDLPEPDC
ncbi:alanine/glycine:cation symporter family protein [Spongorhabdus nitratireducens]